MKLPKGVTLNSTSHNGTIVVIAYDEGFSTLDYKRRGFAIGSGSFARSMSYTGCKWHERLLADAVTELKAIYDTPTKVEK